MKNYRNILSKLTKKSKQNYHKEYFQENKNNLIKIWQGIKQIILIKKHNRVQPTLLKINDSLTTNNRKITEEFNIFFERIPQNTTLIKKRQNPISTFSNYLKNKNLFSLLLQSVTKRNYEHN